MLRRNIKLEGPREFQEQSVTTVDSIARDELSDKPCR